jgi:hypothetical protein
MENLKLYKEAAFMLGVLTAVVCLFLLSGCKKDNPTPTPVAATTDTTKWQDQYGNGGTLPDWTGNTNNNNELVGTNWVLTQVMNGLGSTTMHDTLHFINNTEYYINSDSTHKAMYTLYTSQNNVTLTFKPFIPMNYTQCSTNELGPGFASGQYITGVKFVNLYNTVSTFKAWFTKI